TERAESGNAEPLFDQPDSSRSVHASHAPDKAADWLRRHLSVVLWSVAGSGVLARLVLFAWNQSFWHDEACLAMNVRMKSAAQLLRALDYNQAAPPLFLFFERAMYLAFGPSEPALRLAALLGGL